MDKKEFDERASRLQEVSKIIEKMPTEIRNEAFGLLKGYISQQVAAASRNNNTPELEPDGGNGDNLFSKFLHDKPAENARLVAAYLFQEYGSEPFSVEEVKATAANAGITIPDRVDMTFRNAVEKGKHLFVVAGRGTFKPTVHGESYFKTKYDVKKGTKKRGTDDK